jgi:Zn-dependent oligopeptidase
LLKIKLNPLSKIQLKHWTGQENCWAGQPGIFFNLVSAETSDELQQIAQEVSPLITKFQNDITLNPVLFERIKTVYNQKKTQPECRTANPARKYLPQFCA